MMIMKEIIKGKEGKAMSDIILKKIDENNFVDAFHLKLGEGQEKYVSTQFEVLRRPMCTIISARHLAFTRTKPWWDMSW